MNCRKFSSITAALLLIGTPLYAAPVTVNGDPFQLVASGSTGIQLFGLAADPAGHIYIGNNSNDPGGIPIQLFDPALFSGSAVLLQSFGPSVGDADGIAYGNGFIYSPDRDEGVRRTAVADGTSSLFIAGTGINGTGSPVVYRPSDGHVFVGFGSTVPGAPGQARIDEYTSGGAFVHTFATVAETETMTIDPLTGTIYYATYDSEVRSFNPVTGVDTHIGNATGFVDGGLAFDSKTGLLFVGTANGPNPGLVETINPVTGERKSFASGFNGSLGILRDQASGDLYFLESNNLYRLQNQFVVPEPSAVSLLLVAAIAFGVAQRGKRNA